MPTLSGLRRRGYTPEAIRDFCDRIGVAKTDNARSTSRSSSTAIREDLNQPRAAVHGRAATRSRW